MARTKHDPRPTLRQGIDGVPLGRQTWGSRKDRMGSRLTWPQICRKGELRGRWIALDECTYDPRTAQPTAGVVVDADEDLVALCNRMQACDNKHCAILYCNERATTEEPPPISRSPAPNPPRAYH
jgi:hypothetical protein